MYVYVCCSIFRKKHKRHMHNVGEYMYGKHLIENKLEWLKWKRLAAESIT